MKHATARLISLAAALGMILAALFIFFNLVQPAYETSQAAKAQKLSRDNFLANQKTTLSAVNQVIQKYQGQTAPQTLASLALPTAKNDADLVNQISVLASRYGLAIQNVTISSPGAKSLSGKPKLTNSTSSQSLVKPIGVVNVQLRVAGSYANFKSFLSNLESNIRLMDMTGVAVTPVGKANQDYYTFDLGIASYYQTTN